MPHQQGLDLGNVLQQVENIRGQRVQNQLGQQTLQSNILAQQGSNQFNALLQQHIANPTPQTLNAIAAVNPQIAGQLQGVQAQQREFEREDAQRTIAGIDQVLNSASPRRMAQISFPDAIETFRAQGIDIDELEDDEFISMLTDIKSQLTPIAGADDDTAALQTFAGLTEGLTEEQVEQARLVELGLEARAGRQQVFNIGDVPHVFDPDTGTFVPARVGGEEVTAATVAASEAEIAATTQLATGRAALTTKTIDKGFESIGKIRTNVANINRAIAALDAGARTGAIDRFLPNITAASVELGQIQKELGLDIVGAVTFGALSQGELDLALSTALPVGLDEPALRDFLVRKRDAQNKLISYFTDQINFLDAGGTPVEFLNRQQQEPQDFSTMTDEQLRAIAEGAQ